MVSEVKDRKALEHLVVFMADECRERLQWSLFHEPEREAELRPLLERIDVLIQAVMDGDDA